MFFSFFLYPQVLDSSCNLGSLLVLLLAIRCIIGRSYNFNRSFGLQQIDHNCNFDHNIIDLFDHINNFG
jgi:hypothetical protein